MGVESLACWLKLGYLLCREFHNKRCTANLPSAPLLMCEVPRVAVESSMSASIISQLLPLLSWLFPYMISHAPAIHHWIGLTDAFCRGIGDVWTICAELEESDTGRYALFWSRRLWRNDCRIVTRPRDNPTMFLYSGSKWSPSLQSAGSDRTPDCLISHSKGSRHRFSRRLIYFSRCRVRKEIIPKYCDLIHLPRQSWLFLLLKCSIYVSSNGDRRCLRRPLQISWLPRQELFNSEQTGYRCGCWMSCRNCVEAMYESLLEAWKWLSLGNSWTGVDLMRAIL